MEPTARLAPLLWRREGGEIPGGVAGERTTPEGTRSGQARAEVTEGQGGSH